MSCFQGRMKEYTSVSLDRFDGQNVSSTVFFLSHCHKDHMVGLDWPSFHHKLSSRNDVFLYCSSLTKTLLLADTKYRPLEKFIKILDVNTPTTLTIPDKGCDVRKNSSVLVTALSAGHCPGSVMFLFEGKEGTVLYTGDFRWETNYAKNLQAFRSGDSIKEIKSLYIDTTFCFEDAFHFPSRNDCVDAASDLVSKWLKQSKNHVVSISCKAKYGYEHFLQELYISTGEKVHTSSFKCSVYRQIGELVDVFTTDPSARIHACDYKSSRSLFSKLPCGFVPDDNRDLQVLLLRPSTMFFAMQRPQYRHNDLVVYPKGPRGLHRVCYSFHSSYVEVRDLVMYLRPKQVFPNVKPPNEENMTKVQARLNSFLQLVHLKHVPSLTAPKNILGKLKVRRKLHKAPQWSQSESEELVFDTQVQVMPRQGHQKPETPTRETDMQDSQASINGRTAAKSNESMADSSYQASVMEGEELQLTSSQMESRLPDPPSSSVELMDSEGGGDAGPSVDDTEESYCLYVSGDEDCEEEDRISADIYPDQDDVVVIESSLSQGKDSDDDVVEIVSELEKSSKTEKAVGGDKTKAPRLYSEVESENKGKEWTSAVDSAENVRQETTVQEIKRRKPDDCNDKHVKLTDRVAGSGDGDDDLSLESHSLISPVPSQEGTGGIKLCDTSGKPDESSSLKTKDSPEKTDDSAKDLVETRKKTGVSLLKEEEVINQTDKVMVLDSPNSELLKSSDTACSSDLVSSSSVGKTQKQLRKTGSFDLFDEGNVTDVEDNVIEEIAETQGFDVDLSSDSGVENRIRRRKYITEIDKDEELSLREATAKMLLRLQGTSSHNMPPPGEQIVISDSDSDTESGFLSGGKDNARISQSATTSKAIDYARNLSALVSKVEKRLASSDSEYSPRKRLRLDISRNCESDSDVTLPPSQGSFGSRFHSGLYYDSTDSSSIESDTDSDAVEILYETDANGAKFDVMGNPIQSESGLVTVCVRHVDKSPACKGTDSDIIDLTEENEEEEEKKKEDDRNSEEKVDNEEEMEAAEKDHQIIQHHQN